MRESSWPKIATLSDALSVVAGEPQGTKLGPWLFLVMINDLDVDLDLWKFVDDTTMTESVDKSEPSKIRASVDELASKSQEELRISFAKTKRDFEPITINNKPIDVVSHAKLLGLNISCDLKWNVHISEAVRKVSSRALLPKTTQTGKDCYQHRLLTSSSNLLLQTSKPFIKFSWNGKWKTVSNHLNISCDLKWNVHISEAVRKVSSRALLPKTTQTGKDCYQGINYLLQNLYQASFRVRLSSVP